MFDQENSVHDVRDYHIMNGLKQIKKIIQVIEQFVLVNLKSPLSS